MQLLYWYAIKVENNLVLYYVSSIHIYISATTRLIWNLNKILHLTVLINWRFYNFLAFWLLPSMLTGFDFETHMVITYHCNMYLLRCILSEIHYKKCTGNTNTAFGHAFATFTSTYCIKSWHMYNFCIFPFQLLLCLLYPWKFYWKHLEQWCAKVISLSGILPVFIFPNVFFLHPPFANLWFKYFMPTAAA